MTRSTALRTAALLALVQGAYMLADGLHFLASGAYFGNGVGPWSAIVGAAGIGPRTPLMADLFVTYGVLWLTAAVALAFGRLRYAVAALAFATVWYAPIGTLFSILIGFLASAGRSRRNA